MEEQITTTVAAVSEGTVKISVEKYQELLAKAAEKAPVIQKVIHKTPDILARENKTCGVTFMLVGASCLFVGANLYRDGIRAAKAV